MSKMRCVLRLPRESEETSANLKGAKGMKYILMMNTMKAGEGVPGWPKEDLL
jgi:hypothetical protein